MDDFLNNRQGGPLDRSPGERGRDEKREGSEPILFQSRKVQHGEETKEKVLTRGAGAMKCFSGMGWVRSAPERRTPSVPNGVEWGGPSSGSGNATPSIERRRLVLLIRGESD